MTTERKEITIPLALDDGQGDIKCFNGEEVFVVPNFVDKDWKPKKKNDLEEEFSHRESHITYIDESGRSKLVGRAVPLLSDNPQWHVPVDKHRAASKILPVIHVGLALMTEKIKADVVRVKPLVMGLSQDQLIGETAEKRIARLEELVLKEHNIHVILGDGTVIKKKVIVEGLLVKGQAFGSFCHMALDSQGRMKDATLRNKRSIVYDLGARTRNFLEMDGFNELNSFADYTGMYTIWETIRKELENPNNPNKYNIHLNISEVKRSCSTEENFGRDGFTNTGVDIRSLRDSVYDEHAHEQINEVDGRYASKRDEIQEVYLAGGGSMVLEEWLVPGFENIFPKANVHLLDNTSNVKGLYNFGVYARLEDERLKQMQARLDAQAKTKSKTTTSNNKED